MRKQETLTPRETLVRQLHTLAQRVREGDPQALKMAERLLRRPISRKKPSPPFDAFGVLRDEGENGLRRALEQLELPPLRDILLAYGLDRQRLARKWKNKERLRNYILDRLLVQFRSGDVFLKS